ncbi:hypothetical protein [Streptomyces griseofuscus]|uniref:hypothetical protein n=1 Tax=Streptomyces griseofuscus TaxID=146922 RepID=UPI0033CA265C
MDWKPLIIRLPDAHLPRGLDDGPTCRSCGTAWPCATAAEHLTEGRCQCGAPTWWEKRGPRNWHVGPSCYTAADVVMAQAAELSAARPASYPPSHFYPPKPSRRRRQEPPYQHTPAGPGDIAPGTWVWVKPGGLHPGWGDIHRFAMVTALGTPKCEVWLHCDGTVHQVLADHLILEGTAARQAARAAGMTTLCGPARDGRPLLPGWEWVDWTVAEHLVHARPAAAAAPEPVQAELFATLEPADA